MLHILDWFKILPVVTIDRVKIGAFRVGDPSVVSTYMLSLLINKIY